jgi:signal transduction histidine kinase
MSLGALLTYSLAHYAAYPGVGAFVLLFGIALHCERRQSLAALAGTVLALSVAVATQPDGVTTGSTWFSTELAVAVAWLVGDNLRQRRARWSDLQERNRLLEANREERARQAVAEERLRIARELHDVVAHSLSVIAVQAGVAGHVLDTQPEEARSSLAAITTTSRAALTEMRRMLGILRAAPDGVAARDARPDAPADATSDLTPAPRLADVPELVARARDGGLAATLHIEGEPPALSPVVELSGYRIVQEALTNAIKHGGPHAEVTLSYSAEEVHIVVTDDGIDTARGFDPSENAAIGEARNAARFRADTPGGGHGLIGMRERAAVCGGRLTVGTPPGGGFRVSARLPVTLPAARA